MFLAEALAERAEAQRRLSQLNHRLLLVAKVQEGDEAAEDPQELLAQALGLEDRIVELIQAINRTNLATPHGEGTLADALVARDALRRKRTLIVALAEAAGSRQDRYSASEIKYVATVDAKELWAQADRLSKEFRLLDTQIQQLNWLTEVQGL